MTMLAEKLKDAGADTVGARFTSACVNALRSTRSPLEAWESVGRSFGLEFLSGLERDIRGAAHVEPVLVASTNIGIQKPYQPRAIAPERMETRRKIEEVVRSKFKNSLGVFWSDVGWHELSALQRDGSEAAALLAAGPASVPNDGRNVGQVLGVKEVDRIIGALR